MNKKTKQITKVVFPVAGMGTRFLPATKASAKEMMPVVDKPLIQYAVEEAVAAGMTEMIFITGRGKRAIEDHFDKATELEAELIQRGKHEMLRIVQEIIPRNVSCVYVRQPQALGLGHAVLCALPVVGDEPFRDRAGGRPDRREDAGARPDGCGVRAPRALDRGRAERRSATKRSATASCASTKDRARRTAWAASSRNRRPRMRRRRWAWSAATS